MMILLVIDPSSSCCGYAVFEDDRLADAGRVTPAATRDPANVRIRTMAKDLIDLVIEYRVEQIVIEDTTGKVARRRHGGRGAGLSIYGKAVGWIICAMEKTGRPVDCVLENEWTAGVSKDRRQMAVIAQFPDRYEPSCDPGQDVSDAIYLGQWWLRRRDLADRRIKVVGS